MTDGPVNKYHIERFMTKDNMEREEGKITFWIDYYSHEDDWVTLSDFGFVNSFIWSCNDYEANKDYLRFMYRTFGKEYLDALDEQRRQPFEKEYQEKLAKHEAFIKDVMGE